MQPKRTLYIVVVSCFLLAACSGGANIKISKERNGGGTLPTGSNGGVKKVGKPYKIAGKTYYPKDDPYYDEVGIASWYGKQFHGKRTANGEIFNMNHLTAAHKTLAMPSYVKVTNLSNKRSIIVRVNDRGPFVGDRIIDMSRRGAQLLGFSEKGTTRVRVQAVDSKGRVMSRKGNSDDEYADDAPPPVQTQPQTSIEPNSFLVMIGSFRDRQNAAMRLLDVENAGERGMIYEALVDGVRYYRVVIGPFQQRTLAEDKIDAIQDKGFYDARIVTVE